jgi:general secretion pathway protein F
MAESTERTFYFAAGLPEGGSLDGEIAARSEHDALRQLRSVGYIPVRLDTRPIRTSVLHREIGIGTGRRLSSGEAQAFYRELAILLASGIELTVALAVLSDSLARNSRTRRFADELRRRLRMGSSLADALRKTRFAMQADILPAIEAGERAGELATALATIADRLHESAKLSRTIAGALAYPLFLLVVSIAVIAILAFFVAPNLAGLFVAMDKPVPAVIAILTAAASGLHSSVALVTSCLVTIVLSVLLVVRRRRVRQGLQRLAFALPVLGQASSWAAAGRFAATLKLFLANNISIAGALPSAYAAAGFPLESAGRIALADQVRRGDKLSSVLERDGMLLPKVVHLIRVGEANARLPEVLGGIVEESRLHFERWLSLLSTLLAPVLIVAVGSLVGWIIFTVFSALLGINDLAS